MQSNEKPVAGLTPYVSLLGAFALAVGTSIGWGSLVVTNSDYLSNAGPLGSVLGMIAGALVMLIMARNYTYMIASYPEAGGVYSYVKNVFGYDRAFLISWFLSLTYMAMLWANATSVPLFVRYFVGDIFETGQMYTLFGYKVYLGEVILTIAVFLLVGFITMRYKVIALKLIIAAVLAFAAGITICFLAALAIGGEHARAFDPAFLPDTDALRQVITIAFITPWAFVGFESISHSAEEYTFPIKNLSWLFRIAIAVTTVLYIFVLLLSVTAYPEEYTSWLEYISDLGNIDGIKGLPAFYAAYTYLGNTGVLILMLALVGLILSSLIGNMISLSRLFYAVSKDEVLPGKFSELSKDGIPYKAMMLLLIISLPVPFLGRVAIGWIVDVTTIGAVLLYGFVSGAAMKHARNSGDSTMRAFGTAGLILMIIYGAYMIFESIIGEGGMTREGQLIFIIWSVIGLIYFRFVMVRDQAQRFGRNLTVWIVLVLFIFVTSMIWICEECTTISTQNLIDLRNHYFAGEEITAISEDPELGHYLANLMAMIIGSAAGVFVVFGISLGAMLSNWMYVRKREEEASNELGKVKVIAYQDPLTGVKSKHAFMEYQSEIDEAIDIGDPEQFAVLVCDVNGLKHINDTLGHNAGDRYIKDASQLISDTFKHSPVFRTGGDEFVVLISGPDYDDRKDLVAEFDRTVEANIGTDRVVVSAGLSDFDPEEDHLFHAVFERADKLMYKRKMELKAMGARTRD